MDNQPDGAARLPALDGLRGVAILLVLVLHFTIFGIERPDGGVTGILYRLIQTWWIGVDLFLVLSGFLITGILLRAKGREGFFVNFYARRTLRIFPLYFGVLAIAAVLLPWLFPANVRFQGWAVHSSWYWTYTSNFFITFNGWRPKPIQGLDHFWSLAVEEQFYLLWPLAVYFFDRRRLIILCLACGVASIALRAGLMMSGYGLGAYVLMPARMDALAAGGLVALLAVRPGGLQPFIRHAWGVVFLAAAGVVALAFARGNFGTHDLWVVTLGCTLIAVLFAGVVTLAVAQPDAVPVSVLRSGTLRFFGRYSYGLYVLHHPVLFLIPAATATTVLQNVVPSPIAARSLALLLLFALTVGAAMASWHAYEKQFLKMKDRFESPAPGRRSRQTPSDESLTSRI